METTLIKLVAGYATFVNAGRYNHPEVIEKIQDREGKVIFKRIQEHVINVNQYKVILL